MTLPAQSGELVTRVGTASWLATAGKLLCFRPNGEPPGAKATSEHLFACMYPAGHEGNCLYGNSAQIEAIVARMVGVRP